MRLFLALVLALHVTLAWAQQQSWTPEQRLAMRIAELELDKATMASQIDRLREQLNKVMTELEALKKKPEPEK